MLLKRMGSLMVRMTCMSSGRLAIFLVLSLPAQAQVYKWTDAEGRVHYGNKPPPVSTESTQTLDISSRPAPPGKIDNTGDFARATRKLRELRAFNRGVSVGELDHPINRRNRGKSREPVHIGYEDQTKIDNLNADIRRLSSSTAETPASRSRSLSAAKSELRQIYRKYGIQPP